MRGRNGAVVNRRQRGKMLSVCRKERAFERQDFLLVVNRKKFGLIPFKIALPQTRLQSQM